MPNLDTLRFYSDSGHGWLEVPTPDVVKSGVIPSKYSYRDVGNGKTYLEEDRDASAYLTAIGCRFDLAVLHGGIKEVFIDGDAWIRDLPHWTNRCAICKRQINIEIDPYCESCLLDFCGDDCLRYHLDSSPVLSIWKRIRPA